MTKPIEVFALIVGISMLTYYFAGNTFKNSIQNQLSYDIIWLFLLIMFILYGANSAVKYLQKYSKKELITK